MKCALTVQVVEVMKLMCALTVQVTEAMKCAYIILVMAGYWMTEALPLPITSMIPMVRNLRLYTVHPFF
jgi:hypothetical protein